MEHVAAPSRALGAVPAHGLLGAGLVFVGLIWIAGGVAGLT